MSHDIIATRWQELKELGKGCGEVIGACETSTGLLRLLCRYGKPIPHIGAYLALVEGMLPADDSETVMHLLVNLSEQIEILKRDINELNSTIKLNAVKLQYGDDITNIELGMKYLTKITKSTNDPERQRHEERLVGFCSNELMTKAVEKLLKGLAPGNDSLHTDILETIYSFTCGHRGIMKMMCVQFLQLVCGGLLVIEAYERLVRGEDGVSDMKNWFENTDEELETRFEKYQQKYMELATFKENMRNDLKKEVIDTKMSNKDAVVHLSNLLQDKYDWLETYCVIFNESIFIDYDFSGDYVSLKHNGRIGVIFYRENPGYAAIRDVPVLQSYLAAQLMQIEILITDAVKKCCFSDAARINSYLRNNLSSNGFSVWGSATVKAMRMIIIPAPVIIIIPVYIVSNKALNSFEFSGTSTTVVCNDKGHKHLFLLN